MMKKHRARIEMDQQKLQALLFLPDDSFIYGVEYHPSTTSISFYFSSMKVEPVPEGVEAPIFRHLEYFTKDL